MNIIKFGRGDFFGIIIPGTFLVLNLVLLFPEDMSEFAQRIPAAWAGQEAIIGVGLAVLSYMLGFALRLIKPSYLEALGYPLHIIDILGKPIYQYARSENPERYGEFRRTVRRRARDYWEPFPYVAWFYSSYLPTTAKSYHAFFETLLKSQFNGNVHLMKGNTFINQCKIVILEKSKALADETMFSEGLVRFLSGMTCALIFGFIVALARGGTPILVWGYLLLLLLFLYRLRFIRV